MRAAVTLGLVIAATASACSAIPNLDHGSMGCQNLPTGQNLTPLAAAAASTGEVPDQAPMQRGEPLAGVDVRTKSAAEVGAIARASGALVTYRLQYSTGPVVAGTQEGYSECWCVPPAGRVSDATYGSHGEVIVFVDGTPIPGGRPQPAAGWGC